MPRFDSRLSKREKMPVADADGNVLGSCLISKFRRQKGEAYNEIWLFDVEQRPVAEIRGYRLHSHVRCVGREGISQEGNCPRIDTKDAIVAARVALELVADPAEMIVAIQEIAKTLADLRRLKRGRRRGPY